MNNVLIIVLNYNGAAVLGECLESLKTAGQGFDVLILDNHSSDDSRSIAMRYPSYTWLSLEENRGYAGGNNAGIKYGLSKNYEHILLLNNDTVVSPGFVDRLLEPMNDPQIGFVAPKVYYYDRPDRLSWCGSTVDMWRGASKSIGDGEPDQGQYDTPGVTGFANGCCILIRADVLRKVGLLDERFFIYWEEADLCKRGLLAGYKSYYQPSTWIWHHISATGGNPYLFARNRYWYMKRYATVAQFVCFITYNLLVDTPLLAGHYLLHKDYGRLLKLLKGNMAGALQWP